MAPQLKRNIFSAIFMDLMPGCSEVVRSSWWQTVELTSATSAFSEMNGDGLCGAWEVLILRPIESLLLLQLGCMMKCHRSCRPLSHLLFSCHISLSQYVFLRLWASLLLLSSFFFTSLSTSPSFFSLSSCYVSLFLCQFPFACLCTALSFSLSLSVFAAPSSLLPPIPSLPLVYPPDSLTVKHNAAFSSLHLILYSPPWQKWWLSKHWGVFLIGK